jgi:uncharacterized protein YjbJ (UPF0337 family)
VTGADQSACDCRRVITADFEAESGQYKRRTAMSSANSDKIKGRIKEAVGVVTDNQHLKDAGRAEQATGKVKKAVERVIDKAKS